MDPKALSHLDPKQKDAYARVMGTAAEIHADQDATTNQTSIADTLNNDPAVQPSTSTPFDISTGGLSTSPSLETPSPLSTPASTAIDTATTDSSQSLFSSTPSAEVPTQADTSLSPALSETPASPGTTDLSQTNMAPSADTPMSSSFFSNDPIPSTAVTPDVTPELAPQEAFPPVSAQPEATIASDNLAPVTPYDPSADNNQPQGAVSMEQPFNTQPLPSPADVTQANAQRETSPLLRVLYIVGAVIFFAIYTIFWVKIFNLPFIF